MVQQVVEMGFDRSEIVRAATTLRRLQATSPVHVRPAPDQAVML